MSEWRATTIDGLGSLFDGPHATPTRMHHGPYFLNIASLDSGRLNLADSDHVSEDDFGRWTKRVTPRSGDLLFSYETRLGEAALMPPGVRACLGRRMALLRPDPEVVDPRFLLYLYLSPRMQEAIEVNTIHGATVNRIPLNRMGRWEVSIPDLAEQQAIAEVLGALDDKIAANTALISLELELADRIYPQPLDGQLAPLRASIEVTKGNSYRSADLGESGTALVTLKSITRDGRYASAGLKEFTGSYKKSQRLHAGEVVVAQTDLTQSAEVVGRAVRVPGDSRYTLVASLDLAIVRPLTGLDPLYLLGLLRQSSFREHARMHTTGTTVLHLRTGAIEDFVTRVATPDLQRRYAERVAPLLEHADLLDSENRKLAAIRDALLPQLMSGKLQIRDVEAAASVAGA